jgi:hypothetical protein
MVEGRTMISVKILSQARRAFTVLAVATGLLFAPPVKAADEYPAPGYFLGGLSADSRWNEILAKPGIKADFPFVAFESTYVPLSSVCVDGVMLAIADPRIDTGARVSADILRAQVQAATEAGELAIAPASPTAAATSTDQPSQIAMSFPVSVYKVTERGIRREFLFLFDKPWPIPVCPAK